MLEIKAIIRPFMLDPVLDALHEIEGLPGVTVSEVRGVRAEGGQYGAATMTKLEIMVADPMVDAVVDAIQASAHTGKPGDGRIFVIPVARTVKIRTGEQDHESL